MAAAVIASTLSEQFGRVWRTFRDALSHLDEGQFAAGDVEWLVPRNLAYHILETADFYFSDCEAEAFPWGHVRVCDKAQMLAYTEQVQAKASEWIARRSDGQFLERQTICKWAGATVLDRALYALRHTQHHTAQINAELRRRGLSRGEWC